MKYYEDFEIGDTQTFGEASLTASEIVDFGERYDPQPFHTDPEAAAESIYGGLIASGWQTAGVTMRLLVEHVFADTAAQGAIGVDDLRFSAPVRPGDTLTVESRIVDTEPYSDGLGLVRGQVTVTNQHDETVMTMVGLLLFERREPDE